MDMNSGVFLDGQAGRAAQMHWPATRRISYNCLQGQRQFPLVNKGKDWQTYSSPATASI